MTPEPGPPAVTRPLTRRRSSTLDECLANRAWRYGWTARMAGLARTEAHDDLNLVDLARYAETLTRNGRAQVLKAWREGWDAQLAYTRQQAALNEAVKRGEPIPPRRPD